MIYPEQEKDEAVFEQLMRESGGNEKPDGAHDLNHVRRVLKNAFAIVAKLTEPVDVRILSAACWLHDIVPVKKSDPRHAEAASLSADRAIEILQELEWSAEDSVAVATAIRTHSFSGGGHPQTLEGAVLRDADRLDALGCIGIARMFYVAGCIGSTICHPHDPLAHYRPLNDHRYALDHCFVKLTRLQQEMITEPGKRLAEQRWGTIESFLETLALELEATGVLPSRHT